MISVHLALLIPLLLASGLIGALLALLALLALRARRDRTAPRGLSAAEYIAALKRFEDRSVEAARTLGEEFDRG